MALFRLLWLRRLVRRHTNPIPEQNAHVWKRRLSLAYMLAAWNSFGIVAYLVYQGKGDWAKTHGLTKENPGTAAQQWSETLGIKKATVYRVSGLKVHRYEIELDGESSKICEEIQE